MFVSRVYGSTVYGLGAFERATHRRMANKTQPRKKVDHGGGSLLVVVVVVAVAVVVVSSFSSTLPLLPRLPIHLGFRRRVSTAIRKDKTATGHSKKEGGVRAYLYR